MRYMYNMMGWGGGLDLVTTLLVWTALVLLIALLWKKLNK